MPTRFTFRSPDAAPGGAPAPANTPNFVARSTAGWAPGDSALPSIDDIAADAVAQFTGTASPAATPDESEGPIVDGGLVLPPADRPARPTATPAARPATPAAEPAPTDAEGAEAFDDADLAAEIDAEDADEADGEGEAESGEADGPRLPAPDPKRPNVRFAVADAEGAIEPPVDLRFTFTADGGKVFKDVPLAQLVQHAQRGVFNQRVHDELAEYRQALPEIRSTLDEYEEAVQTPSQRVERLLTDDEYLFTLREEYERAKSPEARAERAERALRERDEEAARTQRIAAVESFVSDRIAPRLDELVSQANGLVSWDEIWGRFDTLLSPYKVRGVIPPEKAGIMADVLERELAPFVEQLVETRQARSTREAARTLAAQRAAKRAEQEASTLAKRQFARRALAPAAGATRAAPPQGQPKPIRNTSDAFDSIMADAAAALGMPGA
jgi:hypothetical protein